MISPNLSIKSYALSFISLYIMIFIISGFFAFSDIQKLNEDIIKTHYISAQKELAEAINTLLHTQTSITNHFAEREQVKQQIDHLKDFSYWQTHRLFSSKILPDYFYDALVYNKKGDNLNRLSISTLPEKIDPENISPYFTIENGITSLIIISPVVDHVHQHKILGYAATKSKVITPLLRIRQFKQIDGLSIKTNILHKQHIQSNELVNYFDFNIRQDNNIFQFSDQIKKVILRNIIALIFFAMLFYFLLSLFLSRPLRKISTYIDTLNNNPKLQYVSELKVKFHIKELEKISNSLTQYQNNLQIVYSNLDAKNKELWQMAHHDALTGALNRRAFEEQWAKMADLFIESRSNVSLILFDINNFKGINDTYGHPAGDIVLKKIADALQEALRKSENIYRIGGDEFACILQTHNPGDALNIANRCHNNIIKIDFSEQGIKEHVRASIGLAHSNTDDYHSISDLLWQADVAVYSAKKPEQNYVITYSDKIKNISDNVLSNKINRIVFNAIESGEGITIFYQPIINLNNERADYYEALLRIKNNSEIIPPGDIFDLIEARKLDFELDTSIFKKIADDFEQGLIPEKTGVSINVSGPSIINHQVVDHLSIFIPYLSHYKIILEITETSLITQINYASNNIKKLKEMGFLIALDDFGSGYSSISYLSSMPVDIVKFDITLIRQLEDYKQLSIIRHLANMIKETGHLLVAEGIETEELNQIVKELGFNYAQGFLYGKPSPF